MKNLAHRQAETCEKRNEHGHDDQKHPKETEEIELSYVVAEVPRLVRGHVVVGPHNEQNRES